MTFVNSLKKAKIYTVVAALAILGSGCGETGRSEAPASVASASAAPVVPLVKVNKPVDWCREHGVPESQCTRCNKDLIPEFQKKGDWCAKHGLPETQCIQCDPKRAETLKALQPKEGTAP